MRKACGVPALALVVILLAGVPSPAAAAAKPEAVMETRLNADVSGDGAADIVELVAEPIEAGSEFASSRKVRFIDGATGRVSELDLGEEGAGYSGRLWTAHLDTNSIPELLVSVETGSSGGEIAAFVITAAGSGGLRHVPAVSRLDSSPYVTWQAKDHHQVEYRHDFGSGVLGLGDTEALAGAYSSSGELVTDYRVYVDRISSIETPVPAGGGKGDIITYRQAWAGYHANTIGIVRTTWRWNGLQLVPVNVEVLPAFSPADYGEYLKSLPRQRPAQAVESAVNDYMVRFKLQPMAVRQEAFREFREFHLALADYLMMNDMVPQGKELARAGYVQVDSGEGMMNTVPDPEFYRTAFTGLLGPEYTEFLELDAIEHTRPYAMDAAMVIPLSEVGARVAAWEHYARSYPDSRLADEARLHYTWLLSAFLLGTNNTPHARYETGMMKPEVLRVLEEHVRVYPGTASAKAVEQALRIYQQNEKVTDAVRSRVMKLVDEAVRTSFGR